MLKNTKGEELLNAIRSVYAVDAVLHPAIIKKVLKQAKNYSFNEKNGVLSKWFFCVLTLFQEIVIYNKLQSMAYDDW